MVLGQDGTIGTFGNTPLSDIDVTFTPLTNATQATITCGSTEVVTGNAAGTLSLDNVTERPRGHRPGPLGAPA